MTAAVMLPAAQSREVELRDGPQWPNVVDDDVRWPNLAASEAPFPTDPARPAFLDVVPDRIRDIHNPKFDLGVLGAAMRDRTTSPEVTGSTASWPSLPAAPTASPWAFEGGLRYWISDGTMRFAFSNGDPAFGRPTSTLDWQSLTGHSGEAFARLDHKPSGVFVKGTFGLGTLRGSYMDDRDYFSGPVLFSDTTSEVREGNMTFASADIGWTYSPTRDLRFGVFVGYQYWREKSTAYGLRCNLTEITPAPCTPGATLVGNDTAVGIFEPSWHAARIGFESRFTFYERWAVNLEIAAIPYAALRNKDSHLLRQDPSDLGPAPNIISDSKYGYGIQAEVFASYAITPNLEIGGGVRAWSLTSDKGRVDFGPSFATAYPLERFEQLRFGGLLQIKGKF
jgi:hypothetical protein